MKPTYHPIYQPLIDPRKEFRLLEVLPASPDGCIRLRMWHAPMFTESQPTKYRCLSYMWGEVNPNENFQVFVNDLVFVIRRNLYEFLDTAQRRFHSQPLWIDAICINQQDDVEKGHQVQRMGPIYRDAEEVLAWLGVAPELTVLFEFTIRYGSEYLRPDSILSAYTQHMVDNYREPLKTGVLHLVDHPYWKRTWILQEVILPRELRLVNGVTENNLAFFPCGMNFPSTTRRHLTNRFEVSRLDYIILQRSSCVDRAPAFSLQNGLKLTYGSQCHDPRDRIYAVLNLVRDGTSFEVNYKENPSQLYWRVLEEFDLWYDPTSVFFMCNALETNSSKLRKHLPLGRQYVPWKINKVVLVKAPNYIYCDQCHTYFGEALGDDILFCTRDSAGASHAKISSGIGMPLMIEFHYMDVDSPHFVANLDFEGDSLVQNSDGEPLGMEHLYSLAKSAAGDPDCWLHVPLEYIFVAIGKQETNPPKKLKQWYLI